MSIVMHTLSKRLFSKAKTDTESVYDVAVGLEHARTSCASHGSHENRVQGQAGKRSHIIQSFSFEIWVICVGKFSEVV